MAEVMSLEQQVTKEQALDGIFEVLNRFNALLMDINDKPQLTAGSELSKVLNSMLDRNFCYTLQMLSWNNFTNLNTEGFRQLLLKCSEVSKKYDLKVTIPQNVEVLGEGIVEDFITDLTQDALEAISRNRTEIGIEKEVLLGQTGQIDFNDENNTKLEWILKSSQAFNAAKAENDTATAEITNLACSHEIDGYDPWYKIQRESEERMQAILTECPQAIFFSGKTDVKKVEKEINSLTKKINAGLNSVEEKIINGTYPVWELTPLVSNLLQKDKYYGRESDILPVFDKWRSDKYKKDLFFTIGSVVLSVAGMLIPGGCCYGLLIAKAATTTAGAVMGIAQSAEEFTQASINKDIAYANVRLTDEQIALVEDTDVREATKEYILSGLFLGLGIFDVADSVQSVKLIFKLDELDDLTRIALKNSKRFGAKAFQNCDAESLSKIGKNLSEQHAIEIFNMKNTVNVVDALSKNAKPKVFLNLSKLEASQVKDALDFFPNNLNTNVIWLGMDDVDAAIVLDCGKSVRNKYNNIKEEFSVNFTDKAKEVETKMNNLLHCKDKSLTFNPSEKIALLKESLPPSEKISPRTTYIRVQTSQRETFAAPNKPFAWVTDPYVLVGNDLPNNFLRSVGFPEKSMKTSENDKIWIDLVVFKDADTANKFIPDEVIDWKRITQELENGINREDKVTLYDLQSKFPDLITKDLKFNTKVFEEKYLDYFSIKHVPGTKYEDKYVKLGDIIYDYTGASGLFTGSGVTASANGLENIERGFNSYMNYKIPEMKDYKNIKIFRFEIQNKVSDIKRVYVKEV